MVSAIVGSLIGGRLVNKFGKKTLAVAATFVAGVLAIGVWFVPNLWTALALNFLSVGFGTIGGVAFTCLVLDQVPKSRGTMMSLNHVFGDVGNTIQPAVGGALLVLFASDLLFSYQAVGLAFAAMSFATAAVIYFLIKDPTKAQMQTPPE
jgi:MFS family permease